MPATSSKNEAGESIDWRQVKWDLFYQRQAEYLQSRSAGLNNFPLHEINRLAYDYASESCREQIQRRIVDNRERVARPTVVT